MNTNQMQIKKHKQTKNTYIIWFTQDMHKSWKKSEIIMLSYFYNVPKWLHLNLHILLYPNRVRVAEQWPLKHFYTVPGWPASWPWHTSILHLGYQHLDLDTILYHTWVTSILALMDFLNGVTSSLSSFSSLKWK